MCTLGNSVVCVHLCRDATCCVDGNVSIISWTEVQPAAESSGQLCLLSRSVITGDHCVYRQFVSDILRSHEH